MSTESKPIKSAADLLNQYPVSGRHYRHNHKLYAAHDVMHFAGEVSRVTALTVQKQIAELVYNYDPTTVDGGMGDLRDKIMELKFEPLIK